MVLAVGEKIHVIDRRQFENDIRRHFFGVIEQIEGSVVRASGYVFVYDLGSSTYVRGDELRTRIFPLTASNRVINVAPTESVVEKVRYETQDGRLIVTDGGAFSLDINEFGAYR